MCTQKLIVLHGLAALSFRFSVFCYHSSSNEGNNAGTGAKMSEAPMPNKDMKAASKPLKEKSSKAERRALQEAQRAAKAAKIGSHFPIFLRCFTSIFQLRVYARVFPNISVSRYL